MFRRFIVFTAAFSTAVAAATAAPAAVTSCSGAGVNASMSVQYGTCKTDLSRGTSATSFTTNGLTVNLSASARNGAEQAAAFWSSNGPIAATEELCVKWKTNSLTLKGRGNIEMVLQISWNGSIQDTLSTGVDTVDSRSLCDPIPSGAANIWWNLETIATAPSKGSQASASTTLIGVTAF